MKRKIIAIFCGISLIFLANLVLAKKADPIGIVIASYGKVYAQAPLGRKVFLSRNSAIFLHDLIITEENSRVQIRFNDDTYVSLQPLSRYRVDEFKFVSAKPRDNKYSANIIKGALITVSGQGKPENYQYKSPLAIIAVRGTGFALTIEPDLRSQNLLVFQGFVLVQSIRPEDIAPALFKAQTMLVGAGQPLSVVSISNTGQITKLRGAFTLTPEATRKKSAAKPPGIVGETVTTESAISDAFADPISPAVIPGPPSPPYIPS